MQIQAGKMPKSQDKGKNLFAFDRRQALNLLNKLMRYEMEFWKASRWELIFIAKIACIMLEEQPEYKRVPCQWSGTLGAELVTAFSSSKG